MDFTEIDLCSKKEVERLTRIFIKYSSSPFHSPYSFLARYASITLGCFRCFEISTPHLSLITAFERGSDNIWKCFIINDGFLISKNLPTLEQMTECLQLSQHKLGARGLYFPQISHESTIYQTMHNNSDILSLERLPSPIISWNVGQNNFIDYISFGSKQRAKRNWSKFDRVLRLEQWIGAEAISALETIELRSWKYQAQQSMYHRDNQLRFYSNWLRSGDLKMHVAVDKNIPVAYRIDSRVRDRVFALKYSYDESYKHCSPGYYLLTQGCFTLWKEKTVNTIDLWGSPDTLKSQIMTSSYGRTDFFWPVCGDGKSLLNERKKHDDSIAFTLESNLGLKNLYTRDAK